MLLGNVRGAFSRRTWGCRWCVTTMDAMQSEGTDRRQEDSDRLNRTTVLRLHPSHAVVGTSKWQAQYTLFEPDIATSNSVRNVPEMRTAFLSRAPVTVSVRA